MSYGWIAHKNRWYSFNILNVRNTCWYLTVNIRTCPHLFAIVLFSAPGIFELLKILIADAIRNSFAIHTQTIRITYAIGMQYIRCYPLLSASSPQFMGNCGLGENVLHLVTVCRATIKSPLRICHELCVWVASDLRTIIEWITNTSSTSKIGQSESVWVSEWSCGKALSVKKEKNPCSAAAPCDDQVWISKDAT